MPANATAAFLGDAQALESASLELHDVHGLWGGRQVWVQGLGPGGGQAQVRQVPAPGGERRFSLAVSPAEARALVDALLDCDFINLRFALRNGLADEARPEIVLVNQAGRRASVACWQGDISAGFKAVYGLLLVLEARAAAGEAESPANT